MSAPQGPQFTKATRQQVKVKIAVAGPSGAGKTLGALSLAKALAQGGTIAMIDTEHGSASLYADRYDFDTLEIDPPYESKKYLAAIEAAIKAGYAVVVIDSISHQWDGDGGILQRKEIADAVPGSNHWTNWGPFTKEHNEFRSALLNAPIHVVATMRSKQAYQQSEGGGKKKIEKLGLAPIQREGMEYEFTLMFDVQMDHKADASKDRTDLFTGKRTNLLDPKTGQAILTWLSSAAPLVEKPKPAIPAPSATAASNGKAAITRETVMPNGAHVGKAIKDLPQEYLASLLDPAKGLPPRWISAVEQELELRRVDDLELQLGDEKPAAAAPSRPMAQSDVLEAEGGEHPAVTVPGEEDESRGPLPY